MKNRRKDKIDIIVKEEKEKKVAGSHLVEDRV